MDTSGAAGCHCMMSLGNSSRDWQFLCDVMTLLGSLCGDRLSFPDAYTYYNLSLIRWLYIKELLRTRDVTSRFLLLLVHCLAAWRWRYVFGMSYFLWHLCS